MLNKALFTEQEFEVIKLKKKILKLEKAIEAFKEYDNERKQYYKDIVQKVGELESYVQEIEDTNNVVALNKKYKEQLEILNKKVYLNKIAEMSEEEVRITFNNNVLRQKLKKFESEIRRLRETNRELILKLNVQHKEQKTDC